MKHETKTIRVVEQIASFLFWSSFFCGTSHGLIVNGIGYAVIYGLARLARHMDKATN